MTKAKSPAVGKYKIVEGKHQMPDGEWKKAGEEVVLSTEEVDKFPGKFMMVMAPAKVEDTDPEGGDPANLPEKTNTAANTAAPVAPSAVPAAAPAPTAPK